MSGLLFALAVSSQQCHFRSFNNFILAGDVRSGIKNKTMLEVDLNPLHINKLSY